MREDRILYVTLDSNVGKEYAARIVRGVAWNVKKLKLHRSGRAACYTIPRSFAGALGIEGGTRVLALGADGTLQIIPIERVVERLGPFREALL